MIDWVSGVRQGYHEGTGMIMQAHIESGAPRTNAWDMIVGSAEEAAAQSGRRSDWSVTRADEQVDGRALVRFDTHWRDALGQPLLTQQLWADPETRLPVRVRNMLRAHERTPGGPEYTVGDYQFPDEGPSNLYDLGAPAGMPIVDTSPVDEGTIPRQAEALLAGMRDAEARFPRAFRLLSWGVEDTDSAINVLWWNGRAKKIPIGDSFTHDFSDCRIRQESHFRDTVSDDERFPPTSASVDELMRWAEGRSPISLCIYDGAMAIIQTGPYPANMRDRQVRAQLFRASFPYFSMDNNMATPIQEVSPHWTDRR